MVVLTIDESINLSSHYSVKLWLFACPAFFPLLPAIASGFLGVLSVVWWACDLVLSRSHTPSTGFRDWLGDGGVILSASELFGALAGDT